MCEVLALLEDACHEIVGIYCIQIFRTDSHSEVIQILHVEVEIVVLISFETWYVILVKCWNRLRFCSTLSRGQLSLRLAGATYRYPSYTQIAPDIDDLIQRHLMQWDFPEVASIALLKKFHWGVKIRSMMLLSLWKGLAMYRASTRSGTDGPGFDCGWRRDTMCRW